MIVNLNFLPIEFFYEAKRIQRGVNGQKSQNGLGIGISPSATAAISESDNGWPASCIIRILLERWLVTALTEKTKKSQADKPAWPFWLKLSAGGQLDGYFE